jgi:hypothetical protein
MLEIGEPSLSEREERLLALEELHAIAVLDWNELATERARVLDPQPTCDVIPAGLSAYRQRLRRIHTHLGARRLRWSSLPVAGGLARSFSSSSG